MKKYKRINKSDRKKKYLENLKIQEENIKKRRKERWLAIAKKTDEEVGILRKNIFKS